MYENGKMRSVETILGLGVGRIKKNDTGENSIMTYCKFFLNVTIYLHYNNNDKNVDNIDSDTLKIM
jgi:hypothetical protein